MTKKRVALVYGGQSGEHEISLISAYAILNNLNPEYFDVIPIGIDKKGQWNFNALPDLMINDATRDKHALPATLPSSTEVSLLTPHSLQITGGPIDVVFPIIHGHQGEDGCLQGLLEISGLPYVGANVTTSAIGMDKDIAKRLVHLDKVPIVPYMAIEKAIFEKNPEEIVHEISQNLSLPLFIKPNQAGSSLGTHKVKQLNELKNALFDAFLYCEKVLVEISINAREIEISVLENPIAGEPPLVSLPGEVRPSQKHEFYSYEAKYNDPNGADLIIPAELSEDQIQEIQMLARTVFKALSCESMARVDFFLDKDSNQLFFNEINTLPGFTPISMYPKMWEASGLPYAELLRILIDLAIARHERQKKLKR